MLTGQGDERIAVQAMRLGVRDYLVKSDLTPELLQLAVRNATIDKPGSATANRWQGQLAESGDTPAQQRNQSSRTSVRQMFDCFGIYSAMRDSSGQISDFRFDYLNESALESNQMTVDDLGKGVCELFPNMRESGLFAEYVRVVETGAPLIKEDLTYTDVFGGHSLTRAYSLQIGKLDDGFTACWRDIIAQKQAELMLCAENDRITNIWESMTDAYVNLDQDWRIVYTNRAATTAFCQLTGLTSEEFLGKTHWEVFPSLVGTIVDREYHRAMTDLVAVHLDVFYEPTRTWLEVHAYPSDAGLGVYFRDITERQRLAAERLDAEQERDRFFNLSIDMLAIGSFDGYFTRLNPAFEQILGFTNAELMARPFIDFVHPDDRAHTIAGAQSLTQGDRVVNFENRYRCKDGSYRWISWSAMPYVQSNAWYAIGHDITDRQQIDRDLRESQDRLRAGIEVAGVGLARFDYATNLVELSPEAAMMYGFDPDTSFVTRAQIHETFHPDERATLEQTISQLLDPAGKGWFAQDHRVVWPNGEVRCLSVRKQVFFDRAGTVEIPLRAILAAIDITDRNQTLADLEARNQELDSFVYIVSHDLKAPLRAVANLSEWIEEDLAGALTVANQEQMMLLRSRVYRMESTIDGLLDYARIGCTDDLNEPVDIAQLLAETIDPLAAPPTFTISIAQNLPTIDTKRLLLTQVFANLIGNGIKHHDRVDGSIQIGIAERDNFYEFTIADDGPGIAPEQHDRMFKIFQAVNPQKRSDSTGIGLAIVKKIVEAEGGTIWLESQLGEGTTFYFTWLQRS